MAIDAAHRSSIYQSLVPVLGEEDANILMSEFPASEADQLVTKGFLRAELAELRTELHGEIGGLRTELHTEIGGLRTELHTEIGGLRTELHTEIGKLDTRIGGLRTELHEEVGSLRTELGTEAGSLRTAIAEQQTHVEAALARQTRWLVATIIAVVPAVAVIGAAVA